MSFKVKSYKDIFLGAMQEQLEAALLNDAPFSAGRSR